MTDVTTPGRRADLEALAGLFFPSLDPLGRFTPVGREELPPVYGTLLAHQGHMTVTLEAFYETLVRVHAVDELAGPDFYARQSLLARHSDGAIVQYGIMRIDLVGLPEKVRGEIASRAAPLGRILIRNNLLREVELRQLWRIEVGEVLARHLAREVGEVIYGRTAAIHLAGQPAVDLLEIVTDRPVLPDQNGPAK